MIIWNKETNELAGGQRFLFNQKGFSKYKDHSYTEEYHRGTYEQLKDLSFCEIGRTFVILCWWLLSSFEQPWLSLKSSHRFVLVLKHLLKGGKSKLLDFLNMSSRVL